MELKNIIKISWFQKGVLVFFIVIFSIIGYRETHFKTTHNFVDIIIYVFVRVIFIFLLMLLLNKFIVPHIKNKVLIRIWFIIKIILIVLVILWILNFALYIIVFKTIFW